MRTSNNDYLIEELIAFSIYQTCSTFLGSVGKVKEIKAFPESYPKGRPGKSACEVELILNSRPLTRSSEDAADATAITSAHFYCRSLL